MGLNFYYNDGLQPKMRAGIINEHECTSMIAMEKASLSILVGIGTNNTSSLEHRAELVAIVLLLPIH